MPAVRSLALAGAMLLSSAPCARAQQGSMVDFVAALDLERQGQPVEAAERFARVLDREPAHLQALFGLERTLRATGGLDRLLPYLDRALVLRPEEPAVRGVQLRTLGALGRDDELEPAVEAWIAAVPEAPDPYREWAFLVAQRGDLPGARAILQRGQARIGGSALQPELAQLAAASGRWVDAARSWHAAILGNAAFANAAGMSLGQTRPDQQAAVLQLLLGELGDSAARRLAADALLGWGRPGEAWALLDANLPGDPREAMGALHWFADRSRLVPSREAARARGYAFERLAGFERGTAAQRSQIEAARAFADAGDRAAAERMLEQIARDPQTAPAGTAEAMAQLIGLMADAGRPGDAERRLAAWEARIPPGELEGLRLRIGQAWLRQGELDRAAAMLGADSSVVAEALRGWIALYRGALADAVEHFQAAGPYAGDRDDATRRTVAVALLQRIAAGEQRDVGTGFLAVERGDTAGAIEHFVRAARGMPPTAGRADLLAFAGRLAADAGDDRAAGLLTEALAADSTGPAAPAAELALAELAWRAGRPDEARRRLEHVILDFPESAAVPEARRLLDRVRGVVPNS
jgi:tetratricopeptide (TPR) repeat protein